MEELLRALILGIIQGLTEFLPVSSSGHLELARYILDDPSAAEMGMLMSVVLHFATALATIIVFRKDIIHLIRASVKGDRKSINYILFILVSMIPAVVVGLFFEDALEQLFNKNLLLVGSMLLVTAGLLFWADKAHDENKPINGPKSWWVGVAQAVAILPGISRSGATISMALLLNMERMEAARFSFLIVVPLIFGKIAKDVLDGALVQPEVQEGPLILGFIMAFISGFIACKWMIRIVRKAKLVYFAIYCCIIGLISIMVGLQWF